MNLTSRDFVIIFMTLSWGSPIGLGIFLALLGVYHKNKSYEEKKK